MSDHSIRIISTRVTCHAENATHFPELINVNFPSHPPTYTPGWRRRPRRMNTIAKQPQLVTDQYHRTPIEADLCSRGTGDCLPNNDLFIIDYHSFPVLFGWSRFDPGEDQTTTPSSSTLQLHSGPTKLLAWRGWALFTCRVSVVVGPTSFYYSSSVFSSASSETAIACFVGNFLYFNLRRTSSLFAGGRGVGGGLRAIHNEPDSSSFNLIDQSATHVHCSCGVNFNYRPTRQPPANFQLWYSTWCSDDVPGEASVWAAAAVSESGCSGLQNLVA